MFIILAPFSLVVVVVVFVFLSPTLLMYATLSSPSLLHALHLIARAPEVFIPPSVGYLGVTASERDRHGAVILCERENVHR